MQKYHVRTIAVVLALSLLSACAAWHPPKAQMPTRDSVVPGQQVTVRGNQNIYAVAMYYKVPMRELIVLNNLQPPYTLKAGQKITLPATAAISADYVSPEIGTAATTTVSTSSSLAPAAVESVSLEPIPVTKSVASSPAPVAATTKTAPATEPAKTSPVDALNAPKPVTKPLVTTATKEAPKEVAAAAPAETDQPQNIPATDDTGDAPDFRWPVDGPVTSGFGPKGSGRSNDGVNIAAPKGAPVVAAAGGTVVYAGNEMKGFGNLILIRHAGDWVTAYAHLDRMLVTKDSVVAKGDMIGMVGRTGNVTTPQLHFEIRHDSKPVNPKDYVE